jgi:hypothetical protein
VLQIYSKECLDKLSVNRHVEDFGWNGVPNGRGFRSSKERMNRLREIIHNSEYNSQLKAVKTISPGPGAYEMRLPTYHRKNWSQPKLTNKPILLIKKLNTSIIEIPNLSAIL